MPLLNYSPNKIGTCLYAMAKLPNPYAMAKLPNPLLLSLDHINIKFKFKHRGKQCSIFYFLTIDFKNK